MSDKDSFYYLNAYQDGITPGQQVTIQHRISFNDWRAGPHIAPLVGLAGEEIMRRKEASIALEKDLYAQLKKLAEAWDEQAAQTMLLERALEYVHTPEVAHTSNEWKEGENGVWEISNRTYIMRYRISYEKAADSYLVSWGIVYNAPKQPDPKYTGATASMWRGRTRKNTPLWRRHSITFRAVSICTVTCFGNCPRRFPMSADGCSASTAIWPPDTHWPLLTNQNQASRQWMTCWPVWTMWIWQSRPSSRLRNAGRSKGKPRPKRSISRHGRTAALCSTVPASMEF
jgi:hypothetical protein